MSDNPTTDFLEEANENLEIETIVKIGDEVLSKRTSKSWETAEENLGKLQRSYKENVLQKYE